MCSHSIANSLFICEKKIRKYLESSLIFVLFLKGKQNKKENPKCDFLFGKDRLWKTEFGLGVRLPIGKVQKDHNASLSP